MGHRLVSVYIGDGEYYTRTDADQVIADKDNEIAELEERLAELQKATDAAWSKVNAMFSEICHHKFKRCRAMAKACAWEQRFWGDGIPAYERQFQWENRAAKWKRRWLQFAEKFKKI